MADSDTFELEVYDDELGRYVRVPDPSAKPLAVRKQSPKATQKRRFEAKQAERRRANEAATSNMDKLGGGIASIPGRVVKYIKSSTPSSVGRDVKGLAKATYDAAVEDPNAFIEDAIAAPFAAIRDFGDVRETARKLRAQGRDAEAEKMEAMAGTVVLSAVPILGRPAGVATRKAIKAATPSLKVTPKLKADAPKPKAFADINADLYGLRKTKDLPRLQASPVKTERLRDAPTPDKISLGDYEGRPFIISMADRSAAGDLITGIGDVDLNLPVGRQGGQNFMFEPTVEDIVWASEAAPVSNIMNLARELYEVTGEKPILMPFRMGGEGSDFATFTGETMMSYADAALGKRDKADMDRLMGKYIPNFAGISDPESYRQFADLSGAKRKQLQLELSNTFGEEGGGLTLPMTRAMIADTSQLNKPSFFLQNVGEIDPTADVVTSTGHRTYSRGVPGRGLGVLRDDINAAQLLTDLSKIYQIGDPREFRGQYADFTDYGKQLKIAEEAAMREKALRQGKTPKVYNTERGGTSKYMQSGAKFGVLTPELLRLLAGE
jgi:hypothetical protein